MESASGEAPSVSKNEVANSGTSTTKVSSKNLNKTNEEQHKNKSRLEKDEIAAKDLKATDAVLKEKISTDTKNTSERSENQSSAAVTDDDTNQSVIKNKQTSSTIVCKQDTTTKISPLPELTKTTPNAPLIPVDILSPPKSESQTDETNTASTSPASEATMSPKLEIVEDGPSAVETAKTTNFGQAKVESTATAVVADTNKPSNSTTKAKSSRASVANGKIPKSGGKPLLSTINKKMNKPTKKRKPKALVALYESEISHNTAGIRLCIKKSDLSASPISAPVKASSGASSKTRKRSRKSKTKIESDDSEFEIKRKKERNTNNNTVQATRSKKSAEDARCIDQSVWGAKLPEEVLYQIFEEVVGKDCIPTLFRLGRVCTLWRRVSLRSSLWKSLDLSNFIKEKYRTELKLKWFIDNRCTGCTELNVSNWKIANIDCVLQKLAVGCPNLESINVTGWKGFQCDHLKFLVDNMKKLQRLDLTSINSEMNASKSAVGLQSLRYALKVLNGRLTHLYLAHNRLPGIPQIIEALASNCPNLVLLDLSNVVTQAVSHAVLHVEKLQQGCPKLKVLRVTNSRMALNTSTMQEMMDSPGFPNLEELSVAAQVGEESRIIGDEHLQRILKTSSKLKLLDVRGCMRLSHESLIRLPAWDIKHLFLSGCSVTRDFSSRLELIASKWAHSLIELDLAWTNVQQPLDNALRVIAEKGLESPLAHLNLCGSSVSEEAVKDILANCAYMSSINLASCRGLPRGVKRLIQGPEELRELREVLKVQMKVKLPSKVIKESLAAADNAALEMNATSSADVDAGGGDGDASEK